MKKQVEYFDTDFLDNKIEIGDKVIIEEPKYRNFIIGTVVTKAPKSCQIEYKDFVGDTQITRQYYGQTIKYPLVKTGKWLGRHGLGGYDDYSCSICGKYEEGTRNPDLLGKYCSYCGALMEGILSC